MKEYVLAVRGVGGYRQYRIPAMAITASGKVIAIYDARADFDDLPGPVDLVIRTSDDNGDTWSQQQIFRQHQGISGYGDATIIVDPDYGDKGRVIVLYQQTEVAGFFESVVGTDLNNPLIAHIGRSISDDDGVTWSHDVITQQLKDELTSGIFATSGMGGRISGGQYAGRLLQSFVLRKETELLSAIGFSDDHGESWQLGALIPGGNETAIVGLSDGSILFHSRATPFRITGRSNDGGVTISEMGFDHSLPDPSDNGSLIMLHNGDLICTHNHDSNLRRNTILKRSIDGGKSWSTGICVEPGSSAYSTSCELQDGSIGILYERNAYQEIVFSKFSISELKSIDTFTELPEVELQIEFSMVQRFIRPARKLITEAQSAQTPIIPIVDMSIYGITERKEVGTESGSNSGHSLMSSEELDELLGPVSPGLHIGDEIRFSARIENQGARNLSRVKLLDRDEKVIFESKILESKKGICLLDLRQTITPTDVGLGAATFKFRLIGEFSGLYDSKGHTFEREINIEMPIYI